MLDRLPLFGRVRGEMVELTGLGREIEILWKSIDQRFQHLLVDEFIVMPDHLHGILILTSGQPGMQLPSLIDIVRDFKSRSTRQYWRLREIQPGLPSRLWQRSFYERVLRSEDDLCEKRDYIRTNPLRYALKRRAGTGPAPTRSS